jgi:Flp pilus assembly protein CpaB
MEHAQKLFSTRGGTMILAVIAAIIAGIAVVVYVANYRDSVKSGGLPATVLVAKSLIPTGTPGETVALKQLYQVQEVRTSQLLDGAISDPTGLRDRVAATDILPGAQLTAADFTTTGGQLASTLTGPQRAITIPLTSAEGLVDTIQDGDQVDVYAGFNVTPVDSRGQPLANGGQSRPMLRLIERDLRVLGVSTDSSTGKVSNITLRTAPRQAAELAFASDNGKVWLVLRPPTGATPSPPSPVTIETLMLGVPPVLMVHSLGGR